MGARHHQSGLLPKSIALGSPLCRFSVAWNVQESTSVVRNVRFQLKHETRNFVTVKHRRRAFAASSKIATLALSQKSQLEAPICYNNVERNDRFGSSSWKSRAGVAYEAHFGAATLHRKRGM